MSDDDHVYYGIGDTLKKRKHLKRLPVGSIVKNKFGFESFVAETGTVNPYGDTALGFGGSSNGPYVVLYLPR